MELRTEGALEGLGFTQCEIDSANLSAEFTLHAPGYEIVRMSRWRGEHSCEYIVWCKDLE